MEDLIQQLRDPDPAKRKAAIIKLGNSKDPAMLKYLGYVYKNDSDATLRDLAYKAGVFIKKQADAQVADEVARAGRFSFATQGTVEDEAPAVQAHASGPVTVSEKDVQRAQMYLDRAVSYHMNRETARVAENLAKALQINPNLRKDTVAASLAVETMKRPAEEAFAMLMNEQVRDNLKQQVKQAKSQEQQAKDSEDLVTASFYLTIYWVGVTVAMLILLLLAINVFVDNLETAAPAMQDPAETQELIDNLKTLGVFPVFLISVIVGTSSVVSTLIYAAAIHAVAKYMFVGSGTFLGFLRIFSIYQLVVTLAQFGVFILYVADPNGNVFFLIAVFGMLGSLYALYYLVQMVSNYYNLGACSGCMALIGAGVLIFIVNFGLSFMIALLINAFAGSG